MKIDRFLRPGWLFLVAGLAYGLFLGVQLGRSYLGAKHDVDRIRHIVASEELILALGDDLQKLSRSIQNLAFPDEDAARVFSEQDSPVDGARDELQRWQDVFERVSYFEHAKFYIVDGHFTDETLTQFVTHVGFKGLAKLRSGNWSGIKAKQQVTWRKAAAGQDAAGQDAEWQIVRWDQDNIKAFEQPALMFREVLDAALPSRDERLRARVSIHEQAVIDFYEHGGKHLPWPYFTPISANQRPGISVVDVDQDGRDDLYVAVRRGPNQLFRNQGDGTFEEVATEWGVDIRDHNSCSIFADFDNDGDPDLMLGRSFQRSIYFENTGHRFVRRAVSDSTDTLPYLVVSMSAADYNGDGLLDIYVCTYRPAVLESIIVDEQSEQEEQEETEDVEDSALDGIANQAKQWPEEFLSADHARMFSRRASKSKSGGGSSGKILDQIGPPNILLVNRGGGRFDIAPESDQLAIWRNTLQATWADFDEDGDPDLYVANDWARDNLFRNDGDRGFTDLTEEMGTTEFGFGMGVTWGDYDRDGMQDIYVSNMFSKAGRRITAQIKELDPSYNRSVDGNYLYRQTAEGFRLVSGLQPPKIPVAEAGWSWGGQFADFDNDGFLDLYALSGYFSAPKQFASNIDL